MQRGNDARVAWAWTCSRSILPSTPVLHQPAAPRIGAAALPVRSVSLDGRRLDHRGAGAPPRAVRVGAGVHLGRPRARRAGAGRVDRHARRAARAVRGRALAVGARLRPDRRGDRRRHAGRPVRGVRHAGTARVTGAARLRGRGRRARRRPDRDGGARRGVDRRRARGAERHLPDPDGGPALGDPAAAQHGPAAVRAAAELAAPARPVPAHRRPGGRASPRRRRGSRGIPRSRPRPTAS